MSPNVTNLLETVLALPEQERMLFADALLASLPEGVDELDDDEFEEELNRRKEEMDRDPSASVPWSELKEIGANPENAALGDEDFTEELRRRSAEMKKNPEIGIPWSKLKNEPWNE